MTRWKLGLLLSALLVGAAGAQDAGGAGQGIDKHEAQAAGRGRRNIRVAQQGATTVLGLIC